MTKVVRDVIEEVKTNKQNTYEKISEDLKPLTKKFDKEIKEKSNLRDVTKQTIPYSEQVQKLALPGPSGEAPKLVTDMNKGFTQEELAFIQNQELSLPADIFLQTLKEPNYAREILA